MRIAVIPARGGSKRIPGKNIREFCGKPIIAYTIEALKNTDIIDHIWVSTDNEEIADVAKKYGADIPFLRPDELADDFTGTIPVISHSINFMKKIGLVPTYVCCAYPTAPMIKSKIIKKAFSKIYSSKWKYVFSATRFSYPIWRSFSVNKLGGLKMFYPKKFNARSQDLPVAWHDAGQFYWGQTESWLKQLPVFEKYSSFIELPSWEVSDIDNEDDWEKAELLYKLLLNNTS